MPDCSGCGRGPDMTMEFTVEMPVPMVLVSRGARRVRDDGWMEITSPDGSVSILCPRCQVPPAGGAPEAP